MRIPSEFQKAAEKHKIEAWLFRECSICNSPIGYRFRNGTVLFCGGCACSDTYGPQRGTWADVADLYNMQTYPETIAKFDKFWHFDEVEVENPRILMPPKVFDFDGVRFVKADEYQKIHAILDRARTHVRAAEKNGSEDAMVLIDEIDAALYGQKAKDS